MQKIESQHPTDGGLLPVPAPRERELVKNEWGGGAAGEHVGNVCTYITMSGLAGTCTSYRDPRRPQCPSRCRRAVSNVGDVADAGVRYLPSARASNDRLGAAPWGTPSPWYHLGGIQPAHVVKSRAKALPRLRRFSGTVLH